MADETTGRANDSKDLASSDSLKPIDTLNQLKKETGAPTAGAPVSIPETHALADELGIVLPKKVTTSPPPPLPRPSDEEKNARASIPPATTTQEPVILSETIIKKATPKPEPEKVAVPAPTAPAPKPIPKVAPAMEPKPIAKSLTPAAPPAPVESKAITPPPQPIDSVAQTVVPKVIPPMESKPIASVSPVAAPIVATLKSAPLPASESPQDKSTPAADDLNSDIAKILQGVKLPERRDVPGKPQKQFDTKTVDTALGATLSPAIETPVFPAVTPPSNESGEQPTVSMRTLKQDLQHVVREEKVSLVHAVALEEQKRHGAQEAYSKIEPSGPRKSHGMLIAAILFLVLGLSAVAGVYFVMQSTGATPPIASDSLVFAEQAVPLPLGEISGTALKNALGQARGAASGNLGSITRIVPVIRSTDATGVESERTATLSEFFAALDVAPPAELMRALSDEFFFGIHTVDENAPLFVIPVASYDRAFAGMLAWERTINAQLAPIFTAVPALQVGEDGLPTERLFTDEIMRNYDVRKLVDDAGATQLYYAFPTRDILVIAESPYSFTEILSRLQAERRL